VGKQALECEWVGFMTTHSPYLRILGFVKDAPRRANNASEWAIRDVHGTPDGPQNYSCLILQQAESVVFRHVEKLDSGRCAKDASVYQRRRSCV